MLFNSLQFLVFFPAIVFLYFLVPHKYRVALLLAGSYYFYLNAKAEYALILAVSTLVSYFTAIFISQSEIQARKKFFLVLSLLVNLGFLFTFKYFNFVSQAIVDFFRVFDLEFTPWRLGWLMPLGISFFTFQSVSYVVDVYRGKIAPERNLGLFAVYLSFFPRLIAGPIERAGNFIPQLREVHSFNSREAADGLKLMAWGFLKKVVVADGLAFFVDRVYGNIHSYSGPALIIATVLYSIQIYCDFSGYTDIAIGSARVMGFKLMDNFSAPYLAKSIAEFWRRWHISLSGWFQDYVFNPLYFAVSKWNCLAGRGARLKHWLSFILAMLVGETLLGLWHGASWNFVFFGLYHGIAIILYYLIKKWWDKLPSAVAIFLTFLIATGSWVLFKSQSLADAGYVYSHLFIASQFGYWHDIMGIFLNYEYEFVVIILPAIIVALTHNQEKNRAGTVEFINSKPRSLRWVVYYCLIMSILMFGSFGSKQFIYFNF